MIEKAERLRSVTEYYFSKKLREVGWRPNNLEDTKTLEWVAMDYFSIVIHIFNDETRNYYQFERLWGDAKIKVIDEE